MVALILALLICAAVLPPPVQSASGRESDITITFSNGPTTDQDVKGTYTLGFGESGSSTLVNITVELFNGTTWSTLSALTGGSPWTYYWDTTDHSNGSYRLRVSGVDSEGNNTAQFSTENFTIANQIPIITGFTLEDVIAGDGSSPSNRAWTRTERELRRGTFRCSQS